MQTDEKLKKCIAYAKMLDANSERAVSVDNLNYFIIYYPPGRFFSYKRLEIIQIFFYLLTWFLAFYLLYLDKNCNTSLNRSG
jgi:hypothetical protein